MIFLLLQAALAVDWMATTWGRESDRDGVLTLSAGVPLRLERAVEVVDAAGRPVKVRAASSDWWIDPAPTTRYLRAPVSTGIWTVDRRQLEADWAAWEHDAAQRLGRGGLPLPPDGVGWVPARVQARADAVDRGTALLGLLADVARHRGIARLGTDRPGRERTWLLAPGEDIALDVHGAIRLGVRPATGAFERIAVEVAGERWEVASSGVTAVGRRLVRGPGAAPLRVRGDPDVPVEVSVTRRRMRTWSTVPGSLGRPDGGIGAVEWDALHGLEADFRPWLDDPRPAVAEWARVRMLERATGAALVELADPALEGGPAVAHAVLARAADLPVDIVLDWRSQITHPDPAALAAWLDGQQATRPHGVALFERARRGRPADRDLARAQTRHAAARTRWSVLPSDRDSEASWAFAVEGTGLPRLQIVPGGSATYRVETADPSLQEAVRWTALPDTVFRLDGERVVGGGVLRFGLSPGEHTVEVETGGLLVPRAGWEGGEPGVGWRAVPLPAVFELPGRGAPLELRVNADGPVTLVFDDGRVVRAVDGEGVTAGPFATSVRVEGVGRAGLAARILRVDRQDPPRLSREDAIATIGRATRVIDAGNLRARADRAVALALLGRRRLAWADTAALADVDGELYRETWAAVASLPVVTRRRGPLDAWTAKAMGREGAERAYGALERTEPVEALVLASEAGEESITQQALGTLRWRPIQRMDRGAGLVPVRQERRERDSLGAAIERALLQSPWPDDETVWVREGAVDRIVSPHGSLELELWCRDLALERAPCALDALGPSVDGAIIGDGGRETLHMEGTEAEIGPVERDQLVVVRASDAEGLLRAGVRRLALAVAGESAVRLPPDRLVRLEVLEGEVRADAPPLAEKDGRTIHHPKGDLRLRGTGTVLLHVSERPEPDADLELERPDRPRPIGVLQVDHLWPELERAEHRILPVGPTARVQFAGVVTLDGQYRERWTTGEVEVAVYRARRRSWSFVEAFVRAPGGIGAVAEHGRRAGRLMVSGRVLGATTFLGDAGEVGGRLHIRAETGPKLLWARLDVWPRAAFVSLQPQRVVDPRIWSRYRLAHYAGVQGRVSMLSEPTRDLRLRSWLQADSNVGASLDRLTVGARGDVLLDRRLRASVSATVDGVFADDLRDTGRVTPSLGVSLDRDWWLGDRRWMLFAAAETNARGDVQASLGISVHGTRGRGLRDAPPTRDLFRTEREGR